MQTHQPKTPPNHALLGQPRLLGVLSFYVSGGGPKAGKAMRQPCWWGGETPPHSDAQQATADPSFETLLPMQDLRTEIASKGLSGIGGAALRFYESLSDQERADIQQETDTWLLAKGERGTLSKKSLLYQAMNQRREEVRPPTPITNGLSVSDIADKLGSAFGPVWHCRETTARLLGAVGWLEKAYHGGTQRRWLVPDYVIAKGYGDNIRHKIGAIGHSKDAVFPVFNPEHGQDIIWTLGVDAILKGLAALSTKKEKLGWLLTKHAYLPDKTIANLSGVNVRTVERRRQNVGCE